MLRDKDSQCEKLVARVAVLSGEVPDHDEIWHRVVVKVKETSQSDLRKRRLRRIKSNKGTKESIAAIEHIVTHVQSY